jgi:peroxiredoxin
MLSVLVVGLVFATAATAVANPGDETPWLGVGIRAGGAGVRVQEVIRDTPADEAGLLPGDEIYEVAGTVVRTPTELKAAVGTHRIGERVVVSVWRDGEQLSFTTTVGARMNDDEILYRRLVGERAPQLDLDVVYGGGGDSFRGAGGRVVVLQFFSLGCLQCLAQHAELSRLADRFSRRDLVVVAVSRDRLRPLSDWAARSKPSFLVATDLSLGVFRDYRIESPEASLVVIDRGGRIGYAGVGGEVNLERARTAAERAIRRQRR